MQPGEIYLAKFPFGDAPGMKLRPVLLLTGPMGAIPEVLVAYISSVIPDQVLPSDLVLDPRLPQFSSTNLKVASALRLHKLATIHGTSLVRYLGRLDSDAQRLVSRKLYDLLKI
jgi:PemK-like, MazF-like toxin of type II toxin-antitoxin system